MWWKKRYKITYRIVLDFFILSKKKRNSLALVLSKRRNNGSVQDSLDIRYIKVTKIKSHPHRENPLHVVMNEESDDSKCYFEYVFFIDLEAHEAMRIQVAFRQL